MEMERKTLKCTRKIDDVERICQQNHDRRVQEMAQYADFGRTEYDAVARRTERIAAKKRKNGLRTACTACQMFTGGGAVFVGLGLAEGNLVGVVVGMIVAATFLICGTALEEILEAA